MAGIDKVGVIGAGLMGNGIAHVAALSGLDVVLMDVHAPALEKALATIGKNLDRQVQKGGVQAADRDAALGRIATATDNSRFGDCDIVIEAATENEAVKQKIYAALCPELRPDAILATNTSSIPVTRLAASTDRPGRFLGMHFFNPVPVLKLVELVPSLMTDEATTERARAYVDGTLGKHAITCQDRAGFVVNSLLIPFILSAIRMYESGFATAEDIDQGFVLGAAHPQGPLAERSQRRPHRVRAPQRRVLCALPGGYAECAGLCALCHRGHRATRRRRRVHYEVPGHFDGGIRRDLGRVRARVPGLHAPLPADGRGGHARRPPRGVERGRGGAEGRPLDPGAGPVRVRRPRRGRVPRPRRRAQPGRRAGPRRQRARRQPDHHALGGGPRTLPLGRGRLVRPRGTARRRRTQAAAHPHPRHLRRPAGPVDGAGRAAGRVQRGVRGGLPLPPRHPGGGHGERAGHPRHRRAAPALPPAWHRAPWSGRRVRKVPAYPSGSVPPSRPPADARARAP